MLRKAITENGVVKGLPATNVRVTVYKGIPFAKPPVGALRWKAPQPITENWEGELEAYTFKNISMQDTPGIGDGIYQREWSCDSEVPMGEDCLYLNIWTPANSTEDNLPVLVWYFGGGFQWGYPYEMEFDGENLAKRGVIVVSVNYRLGAFGFMAHPEITKESPNAPTNFGTLDQQAGLRWVHRNIKAFGGNPDNITIAGQSAGGASVLNQLVCMDNDGLIKQAIIMSGIIRSPYSSDELIEPKTLENAEKKGVSFFEFLGVKSLEEARKIDAFTLRSKYTEYAGSHPRFAPCIDGHFLTDDPVKLALTGKWLNVPVMSGNTEDEFKIMLAAKNTDELFEKAEKLFGSDAKRFMEFEETKKEVAPNRYAEASGIEAAVKAVFDRNSNSERANCYYYRFAPDIPGFDNPGTFHSVDLWFFFESLNKCWRPFVGRHYDLARNMCNYWANFIKTGDPNGEDCDGTKMPEWKPCKKGSRNEMTFTKEGPKATFEESDYISFLADKIAEKILL